MRGRTPEELEEQARKLMLFNENESNKVLACRKVLSSHFAIICTNLLIVFAALFVIFFALDYAATETGGINPVDFASGLLDGALYMAFPIAFYVLLLQLFRICKKPVPDNEPYDSLNPYISRKNPGMMDKVYMIKRILMVFLVGYAVIAIMQSITYIDANSLKSTLESMLGYELSDQDIALMRLQGYNSLIKGVFSGLIAYSVSRAFRSFYETIVFDQTEGKQIELIILSAFCWLFGLVLLTGLVMAYLGLVNPLVGVIYEKGTFNYTDALYIICMLSCIGFFTMLGIGFMKLRKALLENSGSCGKPHVNEQVVYTIDDKDIDE